MSRNLLRGLQTPGDSEKMVRVDIPKLELVAPRELRNKSSSDAAPESSDMSAHKDAQKRGHKAENASTSERSSSWPSMPSWKILTKTRSEISALSSAYPNPRCSRSLGEDRSKVSVAPATISKQSMQQTKSLDDPEGQGEVDYRNDETAETSVRNKSERPRCSTDAVGNLSVTSSFPEDPEDTAPDMPDVRRGKEYRGSVSSLSRRALTTLRRGPGIIIESTLEATKAKKAIHFTASELFRTRSRSPNMPLGCHIEQSARQQGAADIAVGTLLFVLVLVFAGLLYALFVRKKDPIVVSCTDECLRAKRYLNGLINVKYDACDDFYERVCSSWRYKKSSFLLDMFKEARASLNSSLLVASTASASAEVRHAREVYQSCYRYAASRTRLDDTLRAADEIVSFSSLRGAENWNEILQQLIRLSLEVGISSVFSVRFVREKDRVLLQISSGTSIRQKLSPEGGPKEFQHVAREAFSASTENILAIDLKVSEVLTVGTSKDEGEEQGLLDSFVRGAIPGLSAIDWVIAVNKVVPKLTHIRMIDIVIARRMNLVRAALGVLVAAGLQNAVDYLVANTQAQIIGVEFGKSRIKSDIDVRNFCLYVTQIGTTYSWPYIVTEVLLSTGKYRALDEMFMSIKKTLTESSVMSWTSDGDNLKAAVEVAKTSLITAQDQPRVTIPAADLHDTKSVYANGGSTFIAVFFKGIKSYHLFWMSHPPSTEVLLLEEQERLGSMLYIPSISAVVVPSLYQTPELFYSPSVPVYFNYGTVGAHLAKAIVVAFASAAAHTTADGRREPWWSDLDPERSNSTIACLLQLRWELGLRNIGTQTNEKDIYSVIIKALSLRLAFQAMRDSFKDVNREDLLSTQWNEAVRTFFTRFCLVFCTNFNREGDRENCLLPLYSMEEFSVAFECHTKSSFKGSICPF